MQLTSKTFLVKCHGFKAIAIECEIRIDARHFFLLFDDVKVQGDLKNDAEQRRQFKG